MAGKPPSRTEGSPPSPREDMLEEIRSSSLNIGTFSIVINLVNNIEQASQDAGTPTTFTARDIADFKEEINIVHKGFLDRISPVSPAATASLFPRVLRMNPFMNEKDKATYTEKWRTQIYPAVRARLESAIKETQPHDDTTRAYWEKQLREFLAEAGEGL